MKKIKMALGAILLSMLCLTACDFTFDLTGGSKNSRSGYRNSNNESTYSSNSPALSITASIGKRAIEVGDIEQINVLITPSIGKTYQKAIDDGELSIISNNPDVLEINNLEVHALAEGSATITVTYLGEYSASFTVKVNEKGAVSQNVSFDIYAFNDTHGNVRDTEGAGLGLAKTTTAIKEMSEGNNNIFISQGDMWQGSIESNYTRGNLVTEWMNQMGFVSMTVGNHEYDWGSQAISQNSELANFPTLGINVLYKNNGERVDYLDASTTFTRAGVKFGVIGAIGNCLSSISYSKVQDVTFATRNALTQLVKDESTRLRQEENCDFIIFSYHGSGSRDETDSYDISLSSGGYVDLVLEGHTHDGYAETDSAGIYHVQCNGYNKNIYKITVDMDVTNCIYEVNPQYINLSYSHSPYKNYAEDDDVNALFTKYYDNYSFAYAEIGSVSESKDSGQLRNKVAELYLEKGMEKWGSQYPNIVLGGGYMSVRSPYILPIGKVTYSMLANLFPFDNDILLCSIKGNEFRKTQYITGTNENYYMAWSEYGNNVKNSLDDNETYYLVTDTYGYDYYKNEDYASSYCASMQIVDLLDENGKYARDLLADYIAEGNWYVEPTIHDGTISNPKTIAEAIEYAVDHPGENAIEAGAEGFYFTGVVYQQANRHSDTSGDLRSVYFKDATASSGMQIYWFSKFQGATLENNWSGIDDLKVGDVLIFWGKPFYYNSSILEFSSGAYCYSINGVLTGPSA